MVFFFFFVVVVVVVVGSWFLVCFVGAWQNQRAFAAHCGI